MATLNAPDDVEVLLRELDQDFMGWDDPPNRLVRALERDELVLYAQPILALGGAQTFAMAEVLVRLQDDDAVFLPPGGFLPLFEHFGLMPRLDRWVAHQAVGYLAQSPRLPCLCIHISTQTLADPEYVPALAAELARQKVSPASLVNEISEDDALECADLVHAFSASIRAIGCRLTVDGFGRRSVSLAPLKTIRPDFVKVDGGIVRSLHINQSSRKKLNAIAHIAKVVGFALIGEGVEREETLAHLRDAGVDYAQGFGIQVPAPIKLIIGC